MTRELDAECARALGLEIIHDDWPCGVPPDGCRPEAALRDDENNGSWFNTRRAVYKVHEPLDEWKADLGLWCSPVPHYSTDPAAARLLEDEIERRGLQESYVKALLMHLGWGDWDIADGLDAGGGWLDKQSLFVLIRATPEQKARAFLEVMKG